MNKFQFIEINHQIMLGKPVIKGTRIKVELVIERLSNSETIDDILIAYPHLSSEAISAALAEYERLTGE